VTEKAILSDFEQRALIPVNILQVSQDAAQLDSLERILNRTKWTLHQAGTVEEAEWLLARHAISVIIWDSELFACDSGRLLSASGRTITAPRSIVSASTEDRAVWAGALELGVSDVVGLPLDAGEICGVVSKTHLSWLSGLLRTTAALRDYNGVAITHIN